jgi:peptidyl-prolyl cis-trans isomerase C
MSATIEVPEFAGSIRITPSSRLLRELLALGCISLGLAACIGTSNDETDSQAVAVVNDHKITVAQLHEVSQPVDSGASAPEAAKQAIDSLIKEELLVQGALMHRLDRDPAVIQAMDGARRQVLARYFVDRNLCPKKAITAGEIEDFYKSNPILFENRKRFHLKTFSIESIELGDNLRAELDRVHSAYELQDLLDEHDIKYTSQVTAFNADQLPVDKLGEFAHADVGDLMIAQQSGGNVLLMLVTAIDGDNAMSFDRAKPYIETYLVNARNGQAINDYLRHAKAVAKITYPQSPGRLEPKKPAPSVREPNATADERIPIEIAELGSARNHAIP